MKTLVGLGTYGTPEFTRLAVRSIRETVKNEHDIFIVVGKNDPETINFCNAESIAYKVHEVNLGFPAAVNDIYDAGWVNGDYDNVIIMGNDVIAYKYAIDSLVDTARETDYEWISSSQYDVKQLISQFPAVRKYFAGESLIFTDFTARPWEAFTGYSEEKQVAEIGFSDVQNLCLYKRSVFEKIGYTDVNYYPAYFVDNDYARRGVNANLKACTLINSKYFHFWSRTIHQGSGGSTHRAFENNKKYYSQKWNGAFGQEQWLIPFNGAGSLKISSRDHELDVINHWKKKL